MKPAVLAIYYKNSEKTFYQQQGKIYQDKNGKWIYLADMTSQKLWRNYNGYSIAGQILEAFIKAKIRPLIVYRRKDMGIIYTTTPSKFTSSGIKVPYGFHTQYVLPLKNWQARSIGQVDLGENFNLPVLSLDKWFKEKDGIKWLDGGGFEYI